MTATQEATETMQTTKGVKWAWPDAQGGRHQWTSPIEQARIVKNAGAAPSGSEARPSASEGSGVAAHASRNYREIMITVSIPLMQCASAISPSSRAERSKWTSSMKAKADSADEETVWSMI